MKLVIRLFAGKLDGAGRKEGNGTLEGRLLRVAPAFYTDPQHCAVAELSRVIQQGNKDALDVILIFILEPSSIFVVNVVFLSRCLHSDDPFLSNWLTRFQGALATPAIVLARCASTLSLPFKNE
jgi:hypothetical protein